MEYTASYDPSIGAQHLSGVSVDKIVYNLKKPLIYKSPKSVKSVFSLRDNFLLDKKDSSIYSFYMAGMEHLNKQFGVKELQTVRSKFYKIM